jgi:hypothetical protein
MSPTVIFVPSPFPKNQEPAEHDLESGLFLRHEIAPPTLEEVWAAAPFIGARRLTLLMLQVLTEIAGAQRAAFALEPITARSVELQRPSTPLEQAVVRRARAEPFVPEQERLGLIEAGTLLQELLQKRLFLEDSLPDADRRFGGTPLPRASDAELLNGVHRALSAIAQRCVGVLHAYTSAETAISDLSKLADLLQRSIARRRPARPTVACTFPRHARPSAPLARKVLVSAQCGVPASRATGD